MADFMHIARFLRFDLLYLLRECEGVLRGTPYRRQQSGPQSEYANLGYYVHGNQCTACNAGRRYGCCQCKQTQERSNRYHLKRGFNLAHGKARLWHRHFDFLGAQKFTQTADVQFACNQNNHRHNDKPYRHHDG